VPTETKRVLLLGAETELGAATARALTEAGHTLALIASTPDAEAAFAVQRLARKLNAATSQAIDASNEMAVRVMVRQVSKELGGLDAAVLCLADPEAIALLRRFGAREMQRSGTPCFVDAVAGDDVLSALAEASPTA
jgi:NAD(P)-dependent dehydrogenase (short-subunit alcohol dehydrogenase family)